MHAVADRIVYSSFFSLHVGAKDETERQRGNITQPGLLTHTSRSMQRKKKSKEKEKERKLFECVGIRREIVLLSFSPYISRSFFFFSFAVLKRACAYFIETIHLQHSFCIVIYIRY